MKFSSPFLNFAGLFTQTVYVNATTYLNVTVTAAANGTSILECWQFTTPFSVSTQSGTVGSMVLQLGNVLKASYSMIPAGTNDGYHTAPAPQYVVLLAGKANISIPEREQSTIISAGENGLLIAVDTPDMSELGHISNFFEESTLLQIPFAGGIMPDHEVLYQEACEGEELRHGS